jgi:hypothetical protein
MVMTNVLTAEDIEARRRAVRAEQRRRDRKAHPEKYAEQRRRYRQAHPERRAEEQRRYVKAHPEKKREARRRYWLAHPGKRAELRQRYHNAHPERRAEVMRRYREKNREKGREYHKAHAEHRRENARRYYQANRARLNARHHQRYVRRKRLLMSETMKRIYAAIPATYPKDVRDEIAGEMLLAIAARKLRRARIDTEAAKFIRAYWRANDHFKMISLDAQLYAGGPTLGDRLVDPNT